jgi:hypothetical protein
LFSNKADPASLLEMKFPVGRSDQESDHQEGVVHHDPARVIHNADTSVLDRLVHAALLLLMLEVVTTDLVSPSA